MIKNYYLEDPDEGYLEAPNERYLEEDPYDEPSLLQPYFVRKGSGVS